LTHSQNKCTTQVSKWTN